MNKQTFVSCPFCLRVFDMEAEPSAKLTLDGKARWAHMTCLPVPHIFAAKPDTKPNGGQQGRTT